MANAFGVNDSEIFARHRASIAASLAHRLEVARAAHNVQLVAMLEQEQRQLGLVSSGVSSLSTLTNQVRAWLHKVVNAIANNSQLTVKQLQDSSGTLWWFAHDPRTGKTLYAETESEVVKWIEDNRLGQ
ncbi:MAG TPA: hypothetical protein V6C78_15065 [Crinalium sp.]|jgi:hypothetical protein